jgi:hypothetical protein
MIPAPPSQPLVSEVRLVAGVANIRHDEPTRDRASDIERFASMLSGGEPWVAAGCEIDNPFSRVAWTRDLAGEHFGLATETPVAVSSSWTVLGRRVWARTKGYALVDPARTTVELRLLDPRSGIKVAILATHRNHLAFGRDQVASSRRGWFSHWRADRRRALFLRLHGYVVVIEEDGNHGGGPIRYGRGQIVAARADVMQITVLAPLGPLAAGISVSTGRPVQRRGYTDHLMLAGSITITKG